MDNAPSVPGAQAANSSAWLVVTHKVDDFDHWKPVYDATAVIKHFHGWRQGHVYAVGGDRNHVMVMEEFDCLERAQAFASCAELRAAMDRGGVIWPPEIRFINAVPPPTR